MITADPGSFRDAENLVFSHKNTFFRAISKKYQKNYDALEISGVFRSLQEQGLMIPHVETDLHEINNFEDLYKIIKPKQISFFSYPYEWCFQQYKDSALATLDICLEALTHDFILKDASAFNIQYLDGKCTLIDSTSLIRYVPGKPWIAYRQFIMHFTAPLLLMSYISPNMNALLRIYPDGVPIELTKKLLPKRAMLNPCAFFNIFLHSWLESKHEKENAYNSAKLDKVKLIAMLHTTREMINGLQLSPQKTVWSDYYVNDASTNPEATKAKEDHLLSLFRKITPSPKTAVDLAGNNGHFSRILAPFLDQIISADYDSFAVNQNYQINKAEDLKNIIPITLNFCNPSSGTGWASAERRSFLERAKCDLSVVLAFIHHLVLTENIPFRLIAQTLSQISPHLIIEFVGESDPKVIQLRKNKNENHPYNEEAFLQSFSLYYRILDREPIIGTQRILFRMERHLSNEHQTSKLSFS